MYNGSSYGWSHGTPHTTTWITNVSAATGGGANSYSRSSDNSRYSGSPASGWGSNGYTYSGSGTNSHGNHWCSRTGSDGQTGYHYSNRDGSYYYSNPDGSTYYNTESSYSTYTAPYGQSFTRNLSGDRSSFSSRSTDSYGYAGSFYDDRSSLHDYTSANETQDVYESESEGEEVQVSEYTEAEWSDYGYGQGSDGFEVLDYDEVSYNSYDDGSYEDGGYGD